MGSRVKSAALLLSLLFLSFLLLQAGCISFGPPSSSKGDGGLRGAPTTTPSADGAIEDITSRNAPRVSLSDVMAALPAAAQEQGIDLKGLTTTQIWGYEVDSSGLARTWVLGMRGEGKTLLLSYNEGQFSVVDIPTSLPVDEVKLGGIVSPEDLFRKNLNRIVQEMNRLKVGEVNPLSLDAKSYQLTIRSPKESSTLTFSAKTGELITSP